MSIRVTTCHGEGFDIFIEVIDPAKSSFVSMYQPGHYVREIRALYDKLGVKSALWTTPELQQLPRSFDPDKRIEYLLEVEQGRVIAYVNEWQWSAYLEGARTDFEYSRTPVDYGATTLLIATPIRKEELKETRRYSQTATGGRQLGERRRHGTRR